ncbi:MAG TPA: prolipoprotein diacylglyceryl transferase [Gemmatimonadaceae bacterium]|jgi:Prolipoprotein diacylglyceryltransferase
MTIHHPLAYDLGPFSFTGFGLAVLLAFVIAQIISQQELERRGHDSTPIADLVFAAVLGGLAGAKLYYVFLVGDITTLWSRGGFVFWGGLLGGIVAVLYVIKRKNLSVMRIADVAGIGIAAAYAVGRTGCWAVGDDYGRPWISQFAVKFPEGAPPSTAGNMHALFGIPIPAGMSPDTVLAVYPTQLFEVAMGFIMFLILWRLRDHKHAEGWLFGVYMVLAGLERFAIEFLRAKDDRFFGGLTMAQLIAVAFVVAGFVWMNARRTVRSGAPGIYAPAT